MGQGAAGGDDRLDGVGEYPSRRATCSRRPQPPAVYTSNDPSQPQQAAVDVAGIEQELGSLGGVRR